MVNLTYLNNISTQQITNVNINSEQDDIIIVHSNIGKYLKNTKAVSVKKYSKSNIYRINFPKRTVISPTYCAMLFSNSIESDDSVVAVTIATIKLEPIFGKYYEELFSIPENMLKLNPIHKVTGLTDNFTFDKDKGILKGRITFLKRVDCRIIFADNTSILIKITPVVR